MARKKTQKYTDEEYKQKLKEVTNDNIICLDPYETANKVLNHYCKKHDNYFLAKPAKFTKQNPQNGCVLCGKEEISSKKIRTHSDFVKKLYEIHGNEFILVDKYNGSYGKLKFIHNKKGDVHFFYSTPNSLLRGQKCGVCSGKQVWPGYNDINSVRPEIGELIINDDKQLYTEFSNHITMFKCSNCGNIIERNISDVTTRGFSCPCCSDGYSYPNKFVYNLLLQIKDDLDHLDREYKPDWCKYIMNGEEKFGRYDIYFEKDKKKYIVELDGGLGHGNKQLDGLNKEESLFIDKQKDLLAESRNITVIRIDCYYHTNNKYEYVKNKLFESELSNILDFSKIDFDKCNNDSISSYVVNACNLWNQGKSVKEISETLNLSTSTITNYLKLSSSSNMCDYSKEESKNRGSANKVYCITTNKVFDSISHAANYYNINASDISKCCRKVSTHGGYLNNIPLIWIYYNDYIEMSEEDIQNYIPKENGNCTKVVCLNNNYLFNMIKEASIWCNCNNRSGILACCQGRYNTSGTHPETGEKLRWMYYDEYIKDNDASSLILYQSA